MASSILDELTSEFKESTYFIRFFTVCTPSFLSSSTSICSFPKSVLISLLSFKILASISCMSYIEVVREKSEALISSTSFVNTATESADILVDLGA